MKILLVDDEIELVSTLAERMEIRGMDVRWFANASEALASADTETYDVAVLDVKMPGIGGLELRKMLKKKHPEMKFIFLTGHGSEKDYHEGIEDGAFYLIKPVKIELLLSKIGEISS